jgi:hypothetical protein
MENIIVQNAQLLTDIESNTDKQQDDKHVIGDFHLCLS